MKTLLAILVGGLGGGSMLLLLLLVLSRFWNGWPAAMLVIGLMFFPAFWLIGGLAWMRMADARKRSRSMWLGALGLDCPRCGRLPMSLPRKWLLGGRETARCGHCGLLLTNDRLPAMVLLVPPLASLLMAPVIGALVRGISPSQTIASLLVAGCLVTLCIALTRPFLACEPLALSPTKAGAPDSSAAHSPHEPAP